ncbi:hypothetical protein F8E02_09290 [Methanoculleus sp. Wushi-C6]|uniref:Uncharacterized protein n=1 Tax=Methanoculleus caldifontis TaxID=2651577 RepID=A0ABU3X2A2_9EURY|nr:hypothetical protein [Methanoculleus sp. Wushi-C6]MDV2482187.1 hypothetical protein [Methanoculleus sp. Wushi-C6]
MTENTSTVIVRDLMAEFAGLTGLDPPRTRPRRYLWTDAYAVCNYLELFRRTNDRAYRDLALRLVDQVHHTLGRHRDDDPRTGWISGLPEEEGEAHPTRGGLRIGKPLPERKPDEPFDERLEWDRDGQYYHYLTKWMHALNRVGRVAADPVYVRWATELAKAAHAAFTYTPPSGGGKSMYWKMSVDLSRPLVPAMGQHDPLDGLVTYSEVRAAAGGTALSAEIADIARICRGGGLATSDPLGIGGLLFDAWRLAQLGRAGSIHEDLPASVLDAALAGLTAFARGGTLRHPADYRLAFRELGLSIGLRAAGALAERVRENPALSRRADALLQYVPLADAIEGFWTDRRNQEAGTWTGHREINMVMLATSLAPGEFLAI